MTREELMDFYAEVIRTSADQVPAGSQVIQACEPTEHGNSLASEHSRFWSELRRTPKTSLRIEFTHFKSTPK
jgi:hypothetical protein